MRFNYPARFDYFLNTELSYRERLESIKLEKLATPLFDAQARQLIASNEELSARGITAIDASGERITVAIEGAIGRQTEILEGALGSISDGVDELNSSLQDISATLNAGFSEMILQQGRMADSLEQLVKLVANPSLTWALEQFTLARDEVRRGLYAEAMESIQRAINGYGSNAGYKTEFRFHGLLGMLYLGEFADHPLEIIDLKKAEVAFSYAAKLRKKDNSLDSVQMLLFASRAAYLDNNIDLALRHAADAESSVPGSLELHEANDFYGKIYCKISFNLCRMVLTKSTVEGTKVPQWCVDALKIIFANDISYAVAATSDPILNGTIELSEAISGAVIALNEERKSSIAEMDKKHLQLAATLKENLSAVRNLTEGNSEAPSFDFTDEMDLLPLPPQKYGSTLTSAFDGKIEFSNRIALVNNTISRVNDKIAKAISYYSSGNFITSKNTEFDWDVIVLKIYAWSVVAITVFGFIVNRINGIDSIWGAIAMSLFVAVTFAFIFGIAAVVIYLVGKPVALGAAERRTHDIRATVESESDKLTSAKLAIADKGNLGLQLNQGYLAYDNLRTVLRARA